MTDLAQTKRIPISCDRDCGGGCPLLAHVRDGRVVKITDNPLGDEYTRGCVKGYSLARIAYDTQRLKRPLLRTGPRGQGRFEEITWARALDLAAEKLAAIRDRHGPLALLPFAGSGSCRAAVHNTGLLAKRFFALFGGFVDRPDSYSSSAADYTVNRLLGTTMVGLDPESLVHSRLILLWGANPASARLFNSRLEACLRRARAGGTKIIVLDPRRSRTVDRLADQWIPIRPGTDSALMAALLQVLISEGLVDGEFVDRHTHGFEGLADYVTGRADGLVRDPAWAEPICGVAAADIRDLALEYGQTRPAALVPGLSIQRTLGGEEAVRFAIVLQAVTGNTGRIGGSSGGPTYKRAGLAFPALPVPVDPNRPMMPVYSWADAALQGRAGGWPTDFRAIYSIGSNYLNQGSDIARNIRAFGRMDFVISHDIFLTPTARYSDLVLPVTTSLEREDVALTTDDRLFYINRAMEPLHEARHDYDILRSLADRLGFGDEFSQGRTADEWLAHLLAGSNIEDPDRFRQTGILVGRSGGRNGLTGFLADPDHRPLNTPSGRIEISCAAFARAGSSPLPQVRCAGPDRDYPLRLVTPHARHRINSQNANLAWADRPTDRCLTMHPDDGAARNLADGDRVRVSSRRGVMEVDVRLTRDIMPGCVCLKQGQWTNRDGRGVEQGGAANSLTSTRPTLPSGGSRTHSVFVQVRTLSRAGQPQADRR